MNTTNDPHYCPVTDTLCPQGKDRASECRSRYESDYDPIRNIRDFELLCCMHFRQQQHESQTPIM